MVCKALDGCRSCRHRSTYLRGCTSLVGTPFCTSNAGLCRREPCESVGLKPVSRERVSHSPHDSVLLGSGEIYARAFLASRRGTFIETLSQPIWTHHRGLCRSLFHCDVL